MRLKAHSFVQLAANCVPLAGVLSWKWDVLSVLLAYWVESVCIMLVNMLLYVCWGLHRKVYRDMALAAPFYLLVFSVVLFVYLELIGYWFGGFPEQDKGVYSTALVLLGTLPPEMLAAGTGFLGSHLFAFIRVYLAQGALRTLDAETIFFPFTCRFIAMQVLVIGCGFVIDMTGSPAWTLTALVVLKSGVALLSDWFMSEYESPPRSAGNDPSN